jgi:2-polyprenyl-3-methyl-5-hydroxy-6-metoxy-1,4-benzoquinol methylase
MMRSQDFSRAFVDHPTPPPSGAPMTQEHDDRIRDQFTRQAVPFSAAPGIRSLDALNRIVAMVDVGENDTVLDVACGPGSLSRSRPTASALP